MRREKRPIITIEVCRTCGWPCNEGKPLTLTPTERAKFSLAHKTDKTRLIDCPTTTVKAL